MKFQAVLILTLTLFAVANGVDYCREDLCPDSKHIACGNTGKFAETCPKNAKILELSSDDIEFIVNKHNILRNRIANGEETGFSTAAKMSTMVWNEELAILAELNVRTCQFEHDECRNTEKLNFAGQNIAITQSSGKLPGLRNFINDSIEHWYSEIKDAFQSDIDKFEYSTRVIGHFTQIVNDLSNQIGCAVVRYSEPPWNNKIITCNYARTNFIDFPIYESGPVASKCTKKTNDEFKALCSIDEPVDPNFFKV